MFMSGIVLCIYGVLQFIDIDAYSDAYIKKVAKHYVFLFGGGGLIFISWTIDKLADRVDEEIEWLYNKISELEKKLDRNI